MATLYTQQTKNVEKTWLLMSLFLVIVIGIGFFFSQYYRNPNILYLFVIFSIGMNIFSYWYSDKIALKMNRAKEIKKSDIMPEEKSTEVCDKCGKPMIIKTGRFGKFLACTGYPECKNIKKFVGEGAVYEKKPVDPKIEEMQKPAGAHIDENNLQTILPSANLAVFGDDYLADENNVKYRNEIEESGK